MNLTSREERILAAAPSAKESFLVLTWLKIGLRYVLGSKPRQWLTWLVAWRFSPEPLRRRLAGVLGVRSNLEWFPRGLVFDNHRVTIARGARVGQGCRFEGGAAIRVLDGAVLRAGELVTTRSNIAGVGAPSLFDSPVQIDGEGR